MRVVIMVDMDFDYARINDVKMSVSDGNTKRTVVVNELKSFTARGTTRCVVCVGGDAGKGRCG